MLLRTVVLLLATALAGALFLGAADTELAQAEQHYRRGLALVNVGRINEASLSFQKALEIAPNHPLVLNALGAALLKNGETATAEQYLKRALQIDLSLTSARKNLAI